MTKDEAARVLREIDTMRVTVRGVQTEIRKRQNRLIRVVAQVFSEASAPLDGVTVETREVVLGYAECPSSPIGVCAYSDRVTSLPGQREALAWEAEHRNTHYPAAIMRLLKTDVCLF